MTKPESKPVGPGDPDKTASEAIRMLQGAIADLSDRGKLDAVERISEELSSALGLAKEALSTVIDRAKEETQKRSLTFDVELRTAAQEAGCDFESRRPFITFGCVTLKEQPSGTWTLSVLDSVPVETVQTGRSEILAKHALGRIQEIESALARAEDFARDLIQAWTVIRRGLTGHDPVPANLLMLLAAHGPNLKKLLTSAEGPCSTTGLSRARFGYLLKRVQNLKEESSGSQLPSFQFAPAVQRDTKQPSTYLSLPDSDDPRRATGSRKIAGISLEGNEP